MNKHLRARSLSVVAITILISLVTSREMVQANVLGNMQTLAPTPDSLFFQNVHSSQTLRKNRFNLGLFTSYIRNEISAYDNLVTPGYVNYKDQAWTYDVIAAWGVTDSFEIFYSMPGFVWQSPDSDQRPQYTISRGVNSHRPGFKYDISQKRGGGFAVSGSVDFPVTKDDPYTGTSPQPIFNLELIFDHRRVKDAFGVNIGYRKRQPGSVPANAAYFYPLKDQFIYSAAYVYGLGSTQRYHAEIYGALPIDKSPHPKMDHVSSLEILLGFKQALTSSIWGHLGGTAEVLPQGLAPQFRLYAGLNWFFGGQEQKEALPPPSTPPAAAPVRHTPPPLLIAPASVQMLEGGQQRFQISGGTPPYSLSLSNDFGTVQQDPPSYTAPTRAGSTSLFITDFSGQSTEVPIVVSPVPKANREITLQDLNFIFNTADLNQTSKQKLENRIARLKRMPIKRIVVIGHTDSIGGDEYNRELSIARARTVANRLISALGLDPEQVVAIGYGKDRPIASNETEEGRLKNRRVELKLYFSR